MKSANTGRREGGKAGRREEEAGSRAAGPRVAIRGVLALLLLGANSPPLLAAQASAPTTYSEPFTDPARDSLVPARSFPVWQAGAVVGLGLLTIAVADEPINDWTLDPANRSDGLDDLANVTRKFGEAVVIVPVTAGLLVVGAVTHDRKVFNAGLRVTASVLLTTAVTQVVKYSLGRERPADTDDPWDFDPFGGAHSMWSGHTSTAFAFATALSLEINRPWATVGLYTLATGTAWARVYENKHWASDVLVAAAAGIACAKLATGRWTIFGLRAPVPLVSEGRAGLMWGGSF